MSDNTLTDPELETLLAADAERRRIEAAEKAVVRDVKLWTGERLRRIRNECHYRQTEIAELLDLDSSARVCRVERRGGLVPREWVPVLESWWRIESKKHIAALKDRIRSIEAL